MEARILLTPRRRFPDRRVPCVVDARPKLARRERERESDSTTKGGGGGGREGREGKRTLGRQEERPEARCCHLLARADAPSHFQSSNAIMANNNESTLIMLPAVAPLLILSLSLCLLAKLSGGHPSVDSLCAAAV